MFLPLIVSVVALLLAVAGGVILARNITNAQTERSHRLAFSVLVPVGAVAVISVYLVVIAGFGPQAPFIIGAVLMAVVGGIVDEFLG
jgi:flagellar biosynthesis component FlhA